MQKKNNKKGFTLAELLIVVAIIAVLVAIAIPVFTAQLNKSKFATDEANARSWYAEQVADYLTDPDNYDQPDTCDVVTKIATITPSGTMGSEDNPFIVTVSADGFDDVTFGG